MNLRIEEFIREDDFIQVFLANEPEPVVIPEHKYLKWAKDEGRLQYCFDSIYNGSHQQQSGTIKPEEYWSMDERIVKKDLEAYIIHKQLHQINA